MSFNPKSNPLKKIHSFFMILLFTGLFAALPGLTVSAQSTESILLAPSLSETPKFIDDSFVPALGGIPALGGVTRTLVQPDGKILIAGPIHLVNGANRNGIARFNADGTLDTTFNTKSGSNGPIAAIGLQSDGKIIIAGTFTNFAGQTVGGIARLLPDGNFDVTFNSAGVYNTTGIVGAVSDISVAPDNRIYIGGGFTSYNGTTVPRFARLYANGILDTTFVTGTGPNSNIQTIAQQPDGKVLIGGLFATYNTNPSARLARVNSDGSFDPTFVVGTGANNTVRDFVIQPDGKIIIGGSFATYNAVAKNGVARLNADGSDDASFSVSGTGAQVFSMVRQSDGKLVVGGNFTGIGGTIRQSIARLNTDGTFDASFDAGAGLSASTLINELAQHTDGSIVLVGNFTAYNGTTRSGIARTNAGGTLDAGFAPTATQAGLIFTMFRQTDGKVLIGGQFQSVNGTPRANVARLNADGSLDTSFNPGTATGLIGIVQAFVVQPDGKIIVGGEFTTFNGTPSKGIVRLNADGSIDTSFVVGTGIDGGVLTLALQTDGKVLVGGVFPTYNSVAGNNLVRLNTDGSRDTSLVTGTGPNSTVKKIVVQADGKILVGGDFATYNAVPKTRLMRINPDGSVDATLNPTFNSGVNDFVVQADGKIVLVGAFTTINTVSRGRIARLNADGSLDTSFDPGTGFGGGSPITIVALPDGKFLVGGQFASANGLPKNRLVRVRANGSFDHKFLLGLGPIGSTNAAVRAIAAHNGKYLIGGDFLNFNTSGRTGLVLMSNASKAPVDYDGDGKTDWAIYRHYGGLGPITYWINTTSGAVSTFDFGIFTIDAVQPGDFDGDGKTDVAVMRGPSFDGTPSGYWINFSSTNQTKFIQFGSVIDRPMMDDYDGDGKDDMAVYRAPTVDDGVGQATWIYRGSLNNPNGNLTYVPWGMRYGTQQDQADKPTPGDFDGDGRADFRVQRRVDTSVTTLSTPAITYTLTAAGQFSYDYFGLAGDRTVPGDYDGDGKIDLAIARGFNIGSNPPTPIIWYIRYTSGIPDATIHWGSGGTDQFAQGDYDGDGTTDMTVYRRAEENNFYVRRSSDLGMSVFHWGQSTQECGPACDIAVANYNNR